MFVCVMIFDLQELMKLSAVLLLLHVCIIPETCFSIGLRHQSVHDDGFSETKVWDDDAVGFSFVETCLITGYELAIRSPWDAFLFHLERLYRHAFSRDFERVITDKHSS
jgi:hypothetical protein